MLELPTANEIRHVAQTATNIFASMGISCCLFGGTACMLHGTTRTPSDVDIVVFSTSHSQEELKQLLVARDANFYTIAAKTPGATYRVLWYRLPASVSVGYRRLRKLCKVDVVVPPVMSIPWIAPAEIERIGGLPVMPFVPLFLLRVQGWDDHGKADKLHMRKKQPVDVRDIQALLRIAVTKGVRLSGRDVEGLAEEWVRLGRERVQQFGLRHVSERERTREILGTHPDLLTPEMR